jgi:hypothetical protein
MYNGIGLRTVRGSGTAGYVNGNKAYVRPSQVRKVVGMNTGTNVSAATGLRARKFVLLKQRASMTGMMLRARVLEFSLPPNFLPCSPAHVRAPQYENIPAPMQQRANQEILEHKQKRAV